MKLIAAILGLVVIGGYLFLTRSGDAVQENEPLTASTPAGQDPAEPGVSRTTAAADTGVDEAAAGKRRSQMTQAYSILQQARQQLKSQANLLRAKIWGREFPTAEAESISNKMRRAYAYLKNPPLLGAFRDTGEIEIELEKIQAMHNDLVELERFIETSASGPE